MITGPGGSGRSTVAAATALQAAAEGTRTLLLSTDPTDTPGALLGTPTGPVPTRVTPHLTVWRPDAPAAFRQDLTAFQDRAANVLDLLGASRLDPEEVTPLPGAEELALLRAIRDAALSDAHDLLVVDLPPAPQALALLALPEELRRYLRRLLPPERQAARALRHDCPQLGGYIRPTAGSRPRLGRPGARGTARSAQSSPRTAYGRRDHCPRRDGYAPDSTLFFRPARARSMMTFSALRLIMPSIGILTSTVSW
jgi:hypothetical protein